MIIYRGKAKNMTREAITIAFLKAPRPVEPPKAVDFSKT